MEGATALSDTEKDDSPDNQKQELDETSEIKFFLEKHASSCSLNEIGLQSSKSLPLDDQDSVAQSEDIAGAEKDNWSHKRSNTVPDLLYQLDRDLPPKARKGIIDTTIPFESVRQAVSKFGGMVGKVQQGLNFERQKSINLELRKVNEEVAKFKRQSESATVAENEALNELEHTKKLVEELKLSIEKTEVEEEHTKQDLALAELWLEELEQGIDMNESTAIKRELEVGHERHTSTIAEISLVEKESEALRQEYESVVKEMGNKMSRSECSVSSSEENKDTSDHLTMEFAATKVMLESSQAALLNAEESRVNATMAYEQERMNWDKELKQAESEAESLSEQLHFTNDLKTKLETASALLSSLKAELTSYAESNKGEDYQKKVNDSETDDLELLCRKRKELEMIKNDIENAKNNMNCLRIAASSLTSEIESEKKSLIAIRNSEGKASQLVSALEAELEKLNAELEQIQAKEMEVREKMAELPKLLKVATHEGEEGQALVNSACEELQRMKEENEQARAMTAITETRLNAVWMEIAAAKASAKLATSAYKALEESENEPVDSPRVITVPVEEYYKLSKIANEAEEHANRRILSAIDEIKCAKESESQSSVKLEEAKKIVKERKEGFKAATKKAQNAKEELQTWMTEHEIERRSSNEAENTVNHLLNPEPKNSGNDQDDNGSECSSVTSPKRLDPESSTGPGSDSLKKKSTFFPRVITFLGKKKANSVKQ